MMIGTGLLLAVALEPAFAAAAPPTEAELATLLASIDARAPRFANLARQIWELAELGYKETRSSALLAHELAAAGR